MVRDGIGLTSEESGELGIKQLVFFSLPFQSCSSAGTGQEAVADDVRSCWCCTGLPKFLIHLHAPCPLRISRNYPL